MGVIEVQEGKVGEVEQEPNRELVQMDLEVEVVVHFVSGVRSN